MLYCIAFIHKTYITYMTKSKNYLKLGSGATSNLHEVLAGLTTFTSMAYILVINPTILGLAGMNFGAVLVATIIVTSLSTFLMGVASNLPYAIAPAMGVSTFITFSMVLRDGASWQQALASVLIAAIVIFLLNLFHLRQKILSSMPPLLIHATVAGIGMFLIFVAFKEIGIIGYETKGLVTLGEIFTKKSFIAFVTLLLMGVLTYFEISATFILGILFSWGLALWFKMTQFEGVFSLPPSLVPTFFKLDFSGFRNTTFWKLTFSLFLVNLFDSSASLHTLKKFLKRDIPAPVVRRALFPDTIGGIVGSLLGSGSTAIHLESASGIHAGGRTGITSIVCAFLFLCCLFFYPVVSSIPSFASAPVLIVIGCLMLKELAFINFKKLTDVIPTLIVIIMMPLTFSIYLGFAFGFISFTLLKLISFQHKEVSALTIFLTILFTVQLLC